jgi:hypothetical protein
VQEFWTLNEDIPECRRGYFNALKPCYGPPKVKPMNTASSEAPWQKRNVYVVNLVNSLPLNKKGMSYRIPWIDVISYQGKCKRKRKKRAERLVAPRHQHSKYWGGSLRWRRYCACRPPIRWPIERKNFSHLKCFRFHLLWFHMKRLHCKRSLVSDTKHRALKPRNAGVRDYITKENTAKYFKLLKLYSRWWDMLDKKQFG